MLFRSARLGQPEVKLGIIPGYGGSQRLPRLVGKGMAHELILTGEMISAEEALRIGLVNRVLPHGELLEAAMRLAATIARRGPLAVTAARRAILEGLTLGLAGGLNNERELFFDIMKSEDAIEGARSFAEKRDPEFHGR